MKTIKSTNKSKQIDKDFAKVCKKHKLERVAIAIEVPAGNGKYSVMSSCHIKGKTGTIQEKKFAIAIGHLFQAIGFQDKNIDIATSIVRSRLMNKPIPSKEELGLSKSNKKKLNAIRNKKFKFIKEKKYQEAAYLRMEERKLLGIYEEESKESHKESPAFDIASITENVADITKIGKILFDAIKKDNNWKTKK